MISDLSAAQWRVLDHAIMDAAGMARTERRELAILDARRQLFAARTTPANGLDPATVRATIEAVRDVQRIQRLSPAMLDEIAAALLESRPINIKAG
ncbi:MAG: hypothetical protein QM598_05650 [Protaetiibacter sp.]